MQKSQSSKENRGKSICLGIEKPAGKNNNSEIKNQNSAFDFKGAVSQGVGAKLEEIIEGKRVFDLKNGMIIVIPEGQELEPTLVRRLEIMAEGE